jgi:hypothetical protein
LSIEYRGCQDVEVVSDRNVEQCPESAATAYSLQQLRAAQEELKATKSEILRLGAVCAGLEAKLQSAEAERDQIDKRLTALLAERRTRSHGTSVGDYATHSAIAAEYSAFAEQNLHMLARACTHGIWDASSNVPAVISALCEVLFRGTKPDRTALERPFTYTAPVSPEKLDEILHHALKIRNMALNASPPGRWDFTFTRGATVDQDRQQPWGSCDPDAPTRILVTPAYMAGGQVYRLQQVYTAPVAVLNCV